MLFKRKYEYAKPLHHYFEILTIEENIKSLQRKSTWKLTREDLPESLPVKVVMYNKAKNHIDQSKIVISCYRRTKSKRSILYQGCKLWNSEISKNLQKQPRRGVPRKRCSENKQKIYRRTLMPKCDFNDVALQLYRNHFGMGVLL